MEELSCRLPVEGIDDKLAKKLDNNGIELNMRQVANLREIYERRYKTSDTDKDTIQWSGADSDATLLTDFYRKLIEEDTESLNLNAELQKYGTFTNVEDAFLTLKTNFTTQEIDGITKDIATLFLDLVSRYARTYGVTRIEVIEGFKSSDGVFTGGATRIFQNVVLSLENRRLELLNNGNRELSDLFNSVIYHKEAFFTYAIKEIYTRERIKIKDDLSYATVSSIEVLNEDELDYDPENAVRESWQEKKDQRNMFKVASPEIRSLLSTIKSGEKSVLGLPKYIDAKKAFDTIRRTLRYITDVNDMMQALEELVNKSPEYASLYQYLNKKENSILRTQLFVHFSTDYQRYSDRYINKGGRRVMRIINYLTKDRILKTWLYSINNKELVPNENTLFEYNVNGSITLNIKAVEKLITKLETIPVQKPEKDGILSSLIQYKDGVRSDSYDIVQLNEALINIFTSFGIHNVNHIVFSKKERDNAYKLLNDFKVLLSNIPKSSNGILFNNFLSIGIGKGDSKTTIRELISKLLVIAVNNDAFNKETDRVRYNGNAYFSDVTSSYMGRMFNSFRRAFRKNDFSYIEEEFLNNPFFTDKNGNILHRWLRDSINNKSNFLSDIIFSRFLGDTDKEFSEFSEKGHIESILDAYFIYTSNKGYRGYPTFILGDSNVSKIIEAPEYSIEELTEEFYNVYIQEENLAETIEAIKEKLKLDGKSTGSLEGITSGKYALLPFLNNAKYRSMLKESDIKNTFTQALNEYMKDSFEEFKNYLNSLDSDFMSKYNTSVSLSINDENLKKFFWNYKFFQVMQMELFTISPIFYKEGSSVDLQKRFKEIHASGKRLDVSAMDHAFQRTIFFNEVSFDRKAMNIAHKQFMRAIEEHFGKDSEIAKAYHDVKVTDGQSYRTLESYREVMKGAGQWSSTAEAAYQQINRVRQDIGENGNITSEQSKILSDLLVVFQPIKPFLYTKERIPITYNGSEKVSQIPVQYKCAEIVIIPELLPVGSKLRDVISYAERNKIDVVCANSAIKVGNFGEVDITKAENKADLEDNLSKAYVHELSYEDYVIQSNTPEHVRESRLFGTQTRKISFSNLDANKEYYDYIGGRKSFNLGKGKTLKTNAYNITRLYIAAIASNILEDCQETIKTLQDSDKVRSMLMNMVMSADRVSEDLILGLLKGESKDKDFLLPLYEGGIKHETFSFLVSEFKKRVNKQKIHGGSAVQATSFGLRSYSEEDGLQYIADPDNPTNILYAECEIAWDLCYKDNLKRDIPLNYDDWCNPDGTLKLSNIETTSKDYISYKGKDGKSYIPLIEQKYPGILNIIAYRIPTEDKYSLLNMRVVRFTRKIDSGGVLKVPNPGTRVAGFDFDIDKLYLLRREYSTIGELDIDKAWRAFYKHLEKTNPSIYNELEGRWLENKGATGKFLDNLGLYIRGLKKYELGEDLGIAKMFHEWIRNKEALFGLEIETYNFDKAPWEQSRAVRNNLIIDLIQKRLEDPSTMSDRFTPGGFDHAIDAMHKINELRNLNIENMDYSDPQTLVAFNQQNQIAGKLIGVFANHNANHNMMSLFRKFEIKDPKNYIKFGDHCMEGLGNFINSQSLIKELLAASVDAVKQPVLNYLNITTLTANSTAMLTRIGYSFYEIGLLFNQPVVRELCKYCEEHNIVNLSSGISRFIEEKKYDNESISSSILLSTKVLEDTIKSKDRNMAVDINVLKLLDTIALYSSELSDIVQSTKFTAANSIGSTPGEIWNKILSVEKFSQNRNNNIIISTPQIKENKEAELIATNKIIPDKVEDNEEYLQTISESPIGYEQVMYDAILAMCSALNSYFPYFNRKYSKIVYSLESVLDYFNSDTIDKVLDYCIPYLLNCREGTLFNPNEVMETSSGEEIPVGTYYREQVPKMLEKFLFENYDLVQNNALLRSLTREISEEIVKVQVSSDLGEGYTTTENKIIYHVIYSLGESGGISEAAQKEIRDAWEVLYFSDNKTLKKIAVDLYFYSYHMSGFGFGSVGFNHLAPTSMKLDLEVTEGVSYADFLQEHLKSSTLLNVSSLFKSYIITHPNDRNFIYEPKTKSQKLVIEKALNGEKDSFTVSEGKGFSTYYGDIVKYKPAIMYNGKLYVAETQDEEVEMFNHAHPKGRMTYRAVNTYDTKYLEYAQNMEEKNVPYYPNETSIPVIEMYNSAVASAKNSVAALIKKYSEKLKNYRDASGNKICN